MDSAAWEAGVEIVKLAMAYSRLAGVAAILVVAVAIVLWRRAKNIRLPESDSPQPPSAELPQPDVAGPPVVESKWAENVVQNDHPLQPDEIGGG